MQQVVLAHGGRVEARSEGLGQGSTFEVRLPLAEAADRVAPPPREEPIPEGIRYRLLVVDDDRDGGEALASYLNELGHEVTAAADGDGALAIAERMQPELVLLDIGMPGMDGHELARRLRALPGSQQAVLVAVTGYDAEADRQRSLAAGCDEHLIKPVDPKAILDLLAKYRASGRLR